MGKKVNFQKVEEELTKALEKMNVQKLLQLATLANALKKKGGEHAGRAAEAEARAKEGVLTLLKEEFHAVRSKDQALLERLHIDQEEYLRWLDHPESLTEEEWKKIQEVREKISEYAKEWHKLLPREKEDEEIIAAERKKHINKRFRIRDDWLPLT